MSSKELAVWAMGQRGPVFGRGPGQPWNGIVERTPCLWITWITDATKRAGVSPDTLQVSFYDVPVKMSSVQLTFGKRWYWLCPRCERRCEAVYYAGVVGCRMCLRLGYLSQSRRSTSVWGFLYDLFADRSLSRGRYDPSNEAGAIVRELENELRQELRNLVAAIDIKPVENTKTAVSEGCQRKRDEAGTEFSWTL